MAGDTSTCDTVARAVRKLQPKLPYGLWAAPCAGGFWATIHNARGTHCVLLSAQAVDDLSRRERLTKADIFETPEKPAKGESMDPMTVMLMMGGGIGVAPRTTGGAPAVDPMLLLALSDGDGLDIDVETLVIEGLDVAETLARKYAKKKGKKFNESAASLIKLGQLPRLPDDTRSRFAVLLSGLQPHHLLRLYGAPTAASADAVADAAADAAVK